MPQVDLRKPILLAFLMLGVTQSAHADLWYEHYENGEVALKAERWKEAIDQFTQALEKRGEPGAQVRTYGVNFVDYHPYLKLGIAYYNLGQYQAALQALDTEERLGAISESPRNLAQLQEYQRRSREAIQTAARAEQETKDAIIAASLEEAGKLEQGGRIDEALASVGKALAVGPDNARALAARKRLQNALGVRERERETETRVAALIDEGKKLIAEQKYEEASSKLNQALALKPSAEAKDLLDDSQNRLRARIEAERDAESRQALVTRGLAEAGRLEKAGRIPEALLSLQSVLAVDPKNREALRLRDRLVQVQAAADLQRQRTEESASLLQQSEGQLGKGNYEGSLTSLNRLLALDPQNGQAVSLLARVYAAMNRSLLGKGETVNLPPAIKLTDLTNGFLDIDGPDPDDTPESTPVQTVSSAEFVLSGLILDDQAPLRVQFFETGIGDGEDRLIQETTFEEERFGELYGKLFRQTLKLRPGLTSLKVVVADPAGLTSTAPYHVVYARPWTSSPWFYSVLASVAVLGAGTAFGYRAHRRNTLLKRRFNPYIAGAPVLDDDLFLGREALLSRILQTIHNNSILLYGERRIGKTSLQHHLKKRLLLVKDPEYDFFPVYIDLQGTPQERFFRTLAEDIFEDLSGHLDGARPARLLAEGEPYAYQAFVRDIRDVLKTLKQRSSKKIKLVLLIDEVDELNSYDPRINQKLRSLFMKSFADEMVAVVSGVGIKKQWESEGSPWYNFFEEIEVKPFTREDAERLIRAPIRGIFQLETGTIDCIIDKSACKPYLIQKLCIALVNRAHHEKRRKITVSDVEAVSTVVEA